MQRRGGQSLIESLMKTEKLATKTKWGDLDCQCMEPEMLQETSPTRTRKICFILGAQRVN